MIFPPALHQSAPEAAVAAVLDDFHLAAAQADEARYFGHLDEGAVFLGTDGTERWTKAQFQAYAHPYFAKGKAWSFKSTRRSISFSPDGRMAWFDEDLATPNLGPCRGSGVLLLKAGVWKIAQYNLALTVPNGLAKEVKARIEAFTSSK
ncbi:MAG: nuclear transport factor 2 family protein [Acidobacteria bacterium]|nr:nuclear transport factor 2 family protein [Acidobacteriota bacterium]